MKKKVYVESSVIGAYFDDRKDVVSAAQKFWTVKWWKEEKSNYEIVCSVAVEDELDNPDYPHSKDAINLINNIPRLSIENLVRDIVKIYIEKQIMPREPLGDALHLAISSYHKCDYLLTWNCNHLANPNKFEAIRLINNSLGIFVPTLVTPNQLVGGSND